MWENDFRLLYNNSDTDEADPSDSQSSQNNVHDSVLSNSISILEVKKAVHTSKREKANGLDGIPSEVLKNDTAILLFNTCFEKGTVPTIWGKSIVNPIP